MSKCFCAKISDKNKFDVILQYVQSKKKIIILRCWFWAEKERKREWKSP